MSPSNPSVCLSALAYCLGDPVPVAELPLPADARSSLLAADSGLEYSCVSSLTAIEMAEKAALATLGQTDLPRDAIDTVLIASNSIHGPLQWTAIMGLPKRLGLSRALPVLINSGDCCNFHTALRHAGSLIHSGGSKHALIIVVDRIADVCPGNYRALRDAGINSDAAASCLVGDTVNGGFKLTALPTYVTDARPADDPQRASPDEFLRVAKFARELFDNLYRTTGRSPKEIDHLIANTYRKCVIEVFAMAARLPTSKAYLRNVPRTGHCFAADNLINLADAVTCGDIKTGNLILAMGSGVNQWGGFLAELQ